MAEIWTYPVNLLPKNIETEDEKRKIIEIIKTRFAIIPSDLEQKVSRQK